jgi:exopolyphosphatase / guanosine-5'-triphosphate,3'-diphosphate pyrophosphatase
MRVGVVDVGTNSTRLLIADVTDGRVDEVLRRSAVTRLGDGVDASGRLGEAAIERVRTVLTAYRADLDAHGLGRAAAVLTSAVRDAANGAEFLASVRADFALDARTIPGEEEARLTFLGATSEREAGDGVPLLVIDVGGGSTELVVGTPGNPPAAVTTQAGVVRQTERHLRSDPPVDAELAELREDVRAIFARERPPGEPRDAIAVAGTATALAAIDLALDPYDPARVQGHRLTVPRCREILARLASMPEAERRAVTGLQPDRAPTIVAGVVILIAALETFGLDAFEVSEHDILAGVALRAASPV